MTDPTPIIDRDAVREEVSARLLRRLLAELVEDLRCAEATVWVISADGTRMDAAINHGPTAGVVESQSVPANESVVGMVAANGFATAIGPADWHNPSVDQATGTPTLAMVAAPILLRGQPIGVLSAINPRDGGVFSAPAVDTIQWRAYLAGLIIGEQAG